MSTITMQLIKEKLVTQEQIQELKKRCFDEKKSLQNLLIETGCLKEEDLYNTAIKVFSGPAIDLDQAAVDTGLVKLIPFEMAKYYGIFPFQIEKDVFSVAMSDPCDIIAREELSFVSNLHITPFLCKNSQISKYINQHYRSMTTVQDILKSTIDDTQVEHIQGEEMTSEEIVDLAITKADDTSFIKLVNKIIHDAVEGRASDIHIEPQEKMTNVRYRVDGDLQSVIKIPNLLHSRLAARIKILGKMDIAEQKKVQEGRIKILIEGKKVDLRISMVPIFYGEKVVMRILDDRSAQFNLNSVGFEDDDLEIFRNAIHRNQGVVLVTGPTGSGKTTTLYTALQEIKNETKNIVTIEDPIECLIDGINQVQLNRFKDVTFSNGLKSILRQDPDVILVGEIRDKETAEIAFRASLTGHLVFSTLHTNSTASSITRLLDIGLEPYLISSSVILFIAQRLVKLICLSCREEYCPDKQLLNKFSNCMPNIHTRRFYKGKGCSHCNFSGFYGRTSIFEILKVDKDIKDLIFNKASENSISKEAVNNGMRTLAESGVMKAAAGLVTLEEIDKVIDIADGQQKVLPQINRITDAITEN